MVAAQALGMEYVYTRVQGDVPSFGMTAAASAPAAGGAGSLDWDQWLNMGAGWTQEEDPVLQRALQEGPGRGFQEVVDLDDLLLMGQGGTTVPAADVAAGKGFMIAHGHPFTDHFCLHEQLWPAYRAVGRRLQLNFAQAEARREGPPAREVCGFGPSLAAPAGAGGAGAPAVLHVAIHMRRGDVMDGHPRDTTRCGQPLFPDWEARGEGWLGYIMSDFRRRSHPFAFYVGVMRSVLAANRAGGSKRPVQFHLYSQTSSAPEGAAKASCGASDMLVEDFPELDFPAAVLQAVKAQEQDGGGEGGGVKVDAVVAIRAAVLEAAFAGRAAGSRPEEGGDQEYLRRAQGLPRQSASAEEADLAAVTEEDLEALQRVHVVLNDRPEECFRCLDAADVLVVARSTLSMVAGMLASEEKQVGKRARRVWVPTFAHGRVCICGPAMRYGWRVRMGGLFVHKVCACIEASIVRCQLLAAHSKRLRRPNETSMTGATLPCPPRATVGGARGLGAFTAGGALGGSGRRVGPGGRWRASPRCAVEAAVRAGILKYQISETGFNV
jgi:hypothetical protein